MKVFISWSGDVSHKVASALRDWLPYVLQAVKPFVSDRDVSKGARWGDVLAQELNDTDFGIICLTAYNMNAPWLNFESGALSRALDHSLVMPFLFHVDRSHLQGPLSQFQSTVYEKSDLLNLLSSINNRLNPDEQLDQERLARTFDRWWPEIQSTLDGLTDSPGGETETGYDWLYTPGDLARIELTTGCKSIWIVTPSPFQDLQLTCVTSVVRRNIEKGVRYTFVMPSSDELEAVKDMLTTIFAGHPDQLVIEEVPRDLFQSMAVTHYVVLNPDAEADYGPRVLLELPIAQRDYWIEVASEAAFGFAARFHKMVSGSADL